MDGVYVEERGARATQNPLRGADEHSAGIDVAPGVVVHDQSLGEAVPVVDPVIEGDAVLGPGLILRDYHQTRHVRDHGAGQPIDGRRQHRLHKPVTPGCPK